MVTRTAKRAVPRPRQATATTRVGSRNRSPRASWLLALVLAGAAAWAYSTSFRGVFVFDDKFGIVQNPNIKALWPLTRSMWAPPELPVTARPIASLSLAINYALAPKAVRDVLAPATPTDPPDTTSLFLENVWGYHAMNLLLHILAAAALFGVVRRTLATRRLASVFDESARPLAFIVALVWAVHPLTTDAVTYVVQRTEVLMGLFYFLTLYCAIRAGESGAASRRWWTIAAIGASALGMGSKQTMVTAPLMVWLWDWTFDASGDVRSGDVRSDGRSGDVRSDGRSGDRRSTGRSSDRLIGLRGRVPLYIGLAATWAILAVLIAVERWPHSVGINREGWTPWTYLLTQTGVIAHYVRLSFIPAPLAIDYGWPMAGSLLDVWPYAAALLIVFGFTVYAVARRQPWGFVGAWFFALLAPSSSVLPLATEVAAERRMYLPLAAIVVAAVIALYLILQRALAAVRDERSRQRTWTVIASVLVGAVVISFGTLTRARNRDYWTEAQIWRDTVEKRPTNSRARMNYGVVLLYARQYDEAERQLREAVRLKDTSAPAHASLGTLLCATGRLDECLAHLERAVALDPDYRDAYASLGEAYAARGRRALAAKYFALAVDAAPDNPFLLNRLGWLLATAPEEAVRNGLKAVEVAERSVRLTSRRNTMSLDTLAAAYAETGRFDAAVAIEREAIALAESQENSAAVQELGARLSVFERGQKFRE